MDSRHLYFLSVILDKGSMVEAANSLAITQPTLTRAIATLEMQAGTKLFSRSRHGVKPTPVGEALAREGRMIQTSTERAQQFVSKYRIGLDQEIRIGVGPVLGFTLFSRVIAALLKSYPQSALSVVVRKPGELYEGLIDGQFDLIIAPVTSERDPQGYRRDLICEDQYGVFSSANHPYSQLEELSATDLRDAKWLTLGHSSPFERNVFEMFSESGIAKIRTQVAFGNDAAQLLQLLAEGEHLAILPKFPMRYYNSHAKLVELPIKTSASRNRDLYLLTHEKLHNTEVYQTLKRLLIEFSEAE